jgi:hypothetical protein
MRGKTLNAFIAKLQSLINKLKNTNGNPGRGQK